MTARPDVVSCSNHLMKAWLFLLRIGYKNLPSIFIARKRLKRFSFPDFLKPVFEGKKFEFQMQKSS